MIDVVGDEQVIADFTKAALMVTVGAADAVKDGGELVATHSQRYVPVNRGQLKDAITSEMVGPLTAEIGPENARGGGYGHIVEKGYTRQAPQPYMSPGLDDAEREVLRGFDDMIGRLL